MFDSFPTLMDIIPEDKIHSVTMWVLGAMAVAVAAMWKVLHGNMKGLGKRLDKCQDDHRSKDEWGIVISGKVGNLEGRLAGREEAKQHLTEVTHEIVEHIDRVGAKLDNVKTELVTEVKDLKTIIATGLT